MTRLLLSLLLMLLLSSCVREKHPVMYRTALEPEEEPLPARYESDDLPAAADELFSDFIYYFAANEGLQRRRIAFPLEISDGKATRNIEESEWQMDSLFMPQGYYLLVFDSQEQRGLPQDTAINVVDVEKIRLQSDSLSRYSFRRTDGRWQMVSVHNNKLSKSPDARFFSFYNQFVSDSTFQQKSLAKEIEFIGSDPDDDFSQMEGFITPDSWEAFAPELPNDSILYNIVYARTSAHAREKLLVVCGVSNGLETELTFTQRRGGWRLSRLAE